MKIVAGVLTWRDGAELVERALESLDVIADELVLIDGVCVGVETDEPPTSDAFGPRARAAHHLSRPLVAQSVKRSMLLDYARVLGGDWLLSLDADERWHEGRLPTRELLGTWRDDAFPVRFAHGFADAGRDHVAASWKLVRVSAWRRWVAGSCFLEHANGRPYYVGGSIDGAPDGFLPTVTHHPEERPAGRRSIRLGELEFELETAPPAALAYRPPSFNAPRVLEVARPLEPLEEGR